MIYFPFEGGLVYTAQGFEPLKDVMGKEVLKASLDYKDVTSDENNNESNPIVLGFMYVKMPMAKIFFENGDVFVCGSLSTLPLISLKTNGIKELPIEFIIGKCKNYMLLDGSKIKGIKIYEKKLIRTTAPIFSFPSFFYGNNFIPLYAYPVSPEILLGTYKELKQLPSLNLGNSSTFDINKNNNKKQFYLILDKEIKVQEGFDEC